MKFTLFLPLLSPKVGWKHRSWKIANSGTDPSHLSSNFFPTKKKKRERKTYLEMRYPIACSFILTP
jgi:hypothetical protein